MAVVGALAIEWLRGRGAASGDLALALFFYGGIALGVVLAARSGTNTNLQPYLFGSILTVTASDVYGVIALGALIVIAMVFTGRALFAVVLDEETARVTGIPAGALNALLAVLTAVTVVAAMRVVGVLLVAALMVLPVATSRQVARSFRTTLLGSAVIGVVSVVVGLAAARQWALAAGGSIVLVVTAAVRAGVARATPARRPHRRAQRPALGLADRAHRGVRVDRPAAAGVDLEVRVRGAARRVAGVADVADHLALAHLPRTALVRVEVEVVVEVAVVAVQVDAVPRRPARLLPDGPGHDGHVGRARAAT